MEKEECPTNHHNQESDHHHQLEQLNGQRHAEVAFLSKHADDVSDQEIRALCLPDHHHHGHVIDEDSDCVVLDGDTVITAEQTTTTTGGHLPAGDLILAESTSSSPILAGSAIAQQQQQEHPTEGEEEDLELAPADHDEDEESVRKSFIRINNSVNNQHHPGQDQEHHSANAEIGASWRLKRVFVQGEDLITPADENEGEEQELVDAATDCLPSSGQGAGEEDAELMEDQEEGEYFEQQKGLSRCVAVTGNLADVVDTTSEEEEQQQLKRGAVTVRNAAGGEEEDEEIDGDHEEENDECTCHPSDGEPEDEVEEFEGKHRPQRNTKKNNKSANGRGGDVVVAVVGRIDDEEDPCPSCCDHQAAAAAAKSEHAIKVVKNQFNGVQSEEAATTTTNAAPTLDNNIKLRDNATKTTSTASSSATASVIIGRDDSNRDNDDEPLFPSSVVHDSGGSSSQSTKLMVISSSTKVILDSNRSSAVLTKQQTPTSVRTATSSAAVGTQGSYGKSEQQLENPKILSKLLQQLFRDEATGRDDVDAVMLSAENSSGGEDNDCEEDKSQTVKLPTASSPTTSMPMDTADCNSNNSATVGSGSGRAFEEMLPSTSSTSTGGSHSASGSRRVMELQIKEEKPDCSEGGAGVEDEEEDVVDGGGHELAEQQQQRVVLQDNENINNRNEGGEGSASGPENRQQLLLHHQQQQMPPMQDFEVENVWADCEEVGDESEEICTCQNYSDAEDAYDEDEQLPSKDVDLSGYSAATHDLLQESHATGENGSSGAASSNGVSVVVTTPLGPGRKRKISEAGSTCSTAVDSPSCGQPNIYGNCLDVIQSKRCRGGKYSSSTGLGSPKTPTSCVAQIPAFLRTPRSAQTIHLMPRESLPLEMGCWLGQFQKWTEFDRVTALNHIIDLCEPSQVRHVMKVIEPQFQRDFISLLPRELALQVLSYLDPTDLLRAAQTCRNWRFLCDDNLLWKDKCKEGNIIIDVESDRPKRGRAGNMPPIASPWKAAYMRQHIIEMNWRSRPIRTPKVLKGHDDHVITCLQFCGNRIVSGSDDNTLKVWSAVTGKCLRVLVGHTGGVWSSQMSSKYIISGSTDRTLKVWNAETGHCEHTLYGHTSTVRCMHLHGEKVVSGSRDATLRVWDVNRGNCLHVLVGHLAAVRCVQYDGKLVVSGAYDYTVKVWNPERQECLHTLQGHTNRVYSLQFDGIHVVSGSLDTSIRVWDAESGSCKHTLMGHQSLTSGMELRDHILVSGNADSTVKIWDIVSGQCLQTLSGPNKHQSAVTCLQFNSRFVITSSDDGTVKLWDVGTGEFIRNLVALDSGGSGGVVWRIRASDTKLICAVGSRNGTEETKLMVLDFDVEGACLKCS